MALAAAPAPAQFQSESYKFLTAIKDGKGDDVITALNKPGNTIVNTRDASTGETALHIVVKRGDAAYVNFLLSRGADPNARDGKGNTPLLLAVNGGNEGLIQLLADGKANPNLGNTSGETPLIIAVQRRDLAMVRDLLAIGADPDQPDVIAGKSARAYATQDPRNTAVAKVIADTPKKARRAVAGPRL
ncbi:ankyrin repeat domain-containing protein [Sphingomonas bacterium]|uniref:ankyrin repeat domain-containing protein n=1 Tax=Sphingomonas bacterium TaxID=1895847 RepID=UPI0020C5E897|nr:ankyrin repeat domain-containing protein [Sphingomonas bacterium]